MDASGAIFVKLFIMSFYVFTCRASVAHGSFGYVVAGGTIRDTPVVGGVGVMVLFFGFLFPSVRRLSAHLFAGFGYGIPSLSVVFSFISGWLYLGP